MEEGMPGPPSAELDLERLSEISGGEAEFEREIVAEYLEQAWALLESATHALESKDTAALRLVAHTLKGSSKTVGAEGVARVAASLEALTADSRHGAAPLLGLVLACLTATESEFERYFDTERGREAA